MRMRHKAYARGELARCSYYIEQPQPFAGRWQQAFEKPQPLILELGCGKGAFAAAYAAAHPDENLIAVDCTSDVLVLAKHKLDAAFGAPEQPVRSCRLVLLNIEHISGAFSAEDSVGCIYINFCNPWPRTSHHKRRLTHPRQLLQYRGFLRDGGEIRFKTDNEPLFADSVRYFGECGFRITWRTDDLHTDEPAWNLRTEYEERFASQGVKIHALIAVKGPLEELPDLKT